MNLKNKYLLTLFISASLISQCDGQNTGHSINAGAVSTSGYSHTIGEIIVTPDSANQNQNGILGLVSSLGLQVVGLAEITADEVQYVYPNPVDDYLHFKSPSNYLVTNVDIYTCDGHFSGRRTISNNQILVSDLKPGVYIIHLTNSDNGISFKIIKQ